MWRAGIWVMLLNPNGGPPQWVRLTEWLGLGAENWRLVMTIEDLAVTMLEAMQNGASVSDIVQMIGDVEKAERELCASMAENYDLGTPDGHGIAAMIRAVKA